MDWLCQSSKLLALNQFSIKANLSVTMIQDLIALFKPYFPICFRQDLFSDAESFKDSIENLLRHRSASDLAKVHECLPDAVRDKVGLL